MSSALLHHAIREKKQVVGTYDGHSRQFCPHVLGYKDGELRVLVYQFGGTSSTGPVRGEWKCFLVSKLSSLFLRDGQWHTDASHRLLGSQQCIDTVTVQVSY
jgi:hypothetical protein